MSNTQRENINAIFTSENLDELEELVDTVNNLIINDSEYYESNTATASDTQGNLTHNPETVTHTININFEQKILSYQNIPVLPPPTNPGIYQGVGPIIFAPQMLLTPATKEVIADTASGGELVNRTPWQVIRMGVNGITPGNIHNDIGIIEPSSPVLIGIVETSSSCGLNVSQEVGNKRQYNSPGLVRQSPKLDSVVDGRLSNDQD